MGNKVFLAKVSDPGLSLTGSEPQKTGFLSQTYCIKTRWLHILEHFLIRLFRPGSGLSFSTGSGIQAFQEPDTDLTQIPYPDLTLIPGSGSDPNT